MDSDENNVRKLETVNAEETEASLQSEPAASVVEANRDMSKVAIIVSLLVGVLLIIFFFGMNRNIAGLTDEVKSLGVLREDVSRLDNRMVEMETEIPGQIKKMIAHDLVNEMAMKAAYLGNTIDDEQLRGKMQEVLMTLKDVRADLEN
ncbi:hypothetical protein GO013_09885 [Pseudodesulfovibrio sp. JC047]|uniref:hypothetical protein n=1 Tax=Pseudodesulfovibrio sp. JC047 TaxID=2683199 RepID=UPI0013CFD5D6|nr:hypothetical protein [Pseudodesulfovibrio sp. JC047]NDV19729.1 hypothetical protein [Pseudodesulfovibrio sp. JC047]